MTSNSVSRSPREDGELEDGEICDDETEESIPLRRGDGSRPGRGAPPRPRKPHQHPRNMPPDFRLLLPYNRAHGHGPFPTSHRQQCGPSGPDRPAAPSPPPMLQLPLPPPPGIGPHDEPSPRTSFWERSHGALGRFRHRVMPNGGRGSWNRGPRGPLGRYLPGESHGNKRESPSRKQKFQGRTPGRKAAHSVPRAESTVDESFEDLLSKYKQIQLELECIRKEETMALEPPGSPVRAQSPAPAAGAPDAAPEAAPEEAQKKVFQAFNIKPLRQKHVVPANLGELQRRWTEQDGDRGATEDALQQELTAGGGAEPEATKTPCPTCSQEADESKTCSCRRQSSTSSEDSAVSPDKPPVKMEEEELSELQLRLLALQSASKKWQQKEQQVMKKSKDRITKSSPPSRRVTTRSAAAAAAATAAAAAAATTSDRSRTRARPPERERPKLSPKPGAKAAADRGRTPGKAHLAKKTVCPGSSAKQAFRKQQLRTWKLQQQQEQEDKRRQEEEERRKREEEIRRIRDLSNQDEQYNRFMKLVAGRTTARSKSRDREHRKVVGKQDASGNLYQYDNYDEVAMDTDSETSSPVPSPTPQQLPAEEPGTFPQVSLYLSDPHRFGMDLSTFLTPMLSAAPPPPPPLPPPPDELEPPPKPPFADEEEEEEMLLRETCLMSMANKRVAASEDKMSSDPPSPGRQPPPRSIQLPPGRGNLSTVSLNTVPQTRSKFSRGHHSPRTPLVLPRHKSVVVSLNDSDDSDSDVDSSSSTQGAFGGLEFMIKEARRTAEAAKPKVASGSEKENNPVRTPETLSEAKKVEYRLLKEEIASREKQKMMKEPGRSSSSASADCGLEPAVKGAAELKLMEAEQKLSKHRELLQRDEAMLRHLLQQEQKKKEALKASEGKVSKLREQLQASERIVSANRTLLKKLQEQVQRVEHRVSIKKSLAVRLEKELSQAQLGVYRGDKRRPESTHTAPSKLQRLDGAPQGSERHFAELIAQKQRLQQLESEYALKIQKLKEAQAQRHKAAPADPVPSDPPLPPPSASFPVPQPSLHDLTQDKLTLDSEDAPEPEEHEPESAPTAATSGGRRHSLRQSSSSFTKPKLEQLGSTPNKDSSSAKPTTSRSPAEVLAGLDVDALRLRGQQQARLGELLLAELQAVGGAVGVAVGEAPDRQVLSLEGEAATGSQSGASELRPVPFGPYHSPLLVFRSYRFSPYYRTKEKLSLSSVSFSNAIDPEKRFCRFDLTGTCNDDGCTWQHMRNCTLSGNQLFQDLLSYNLPLIGCSDSSSDQDISTATETYMKKLFGPNRDRMGVDQKAVLLVSKVNESKRHVPPFTTCKDVRRWRPKPSAPSSYDPEDDSDPETSSTHMTTWRQEDCSRTSLSALDVCVTSEDRRYFVSETDDISNLESSVLDNPGDTQLWIKLAFKYLNQQDTPAAECLEAALNTLSRALETNCEDPEVWSHYLSLFSRRGSRDEVQQMCEMAVEHAPSCQVWWQYLSLESCFQGKDYVCERLLHFLLSEAAAAAVSPRLSFQLMEALLYRVHLNVFTGRMESALAILQNALKSAQGPSLAEHLAPPHRALLWLSYIHLTEFDRLPSSLYDPAQSGPTRLVSTESFRLPWRSRQDVSTPPDILIALFHDAISQCNDESLSPRERTSACLPLHTNLIFLNKLLDRCDEGVTLCRSLLEVCPESCPLRDALADLHLSTGDGDQAVSMWLHALAECPNNAQVFYHSCKFLMAQDKSTAIAPLFRGFILSLCEDQQSQKKPVDVLRHILGFPTEELLRGPIIRELQDQLQHQMPYLHMIHCRWQWLHGSEDDTIDAFETALGSAMELEELHQLWMDYLQFSSSRSRLIPDLVQRCLSTVPSRLEVPFNPAEFWSCYRFHNKVVTLYLSWTPQSQHAVVLERLRYAMPNNTELGLRLLHQEWKDDNEEQLRFQARMLSNSTPKCLSFWKIAIAVETELKQRSEVRVLYQQALLHLPLCAALWKDRLLFEAADGVQTDRLQRLLSRCEQVGVALSESQ